MTKINVLVIPSDTSGVGKYRSTDPHIKLQNMYPNDFHVDIEYDVDLLEDKYRVMDLSNPMMSDKDKMFIDILRERLSSHREGVEDIRTSHVTK